MGHVLTDTCDGCGIETKESLYRKVGTCNFYCRKCTDKGAINSVDIERECPWCQDDKLEYVEFIWEDAPWGCVRCYKCSCHGPISDNKKDAIRIWDKR